MLNFTLSLQPVIQFKTLPPPLGFEELVSALADGAQQEHQLARPCGGRAAHHSPFELRHEFSEAC